MKELSGNKYITIYAPEMDEIDITGRLLEKYVEGAIYDEKNKVLSVPKEILKNKNNDETWMGKSE